MSTGPAQHAKLSPSGSHKWLVCAGSVAMESQFRDESSEFADEGTAAHTLAAMCLTENKDALAYKGRRIPVGYRTFEVDDDMAGFVQTYVDNIRQYADGHELMVEQQLPIDHITGEPGATGTGDAVIVTADGDELQVHDLKYGRGVEVEAEHNSQLMMYGLGALELVGLLGYTPKRIRLVIHQPRLRSAPSEWDCTIDELLKFGEKAKERAYHAMQVLQNEKPGAYIHHLTPGDHCRQSFCKARGTCPKLRGLALETIADDFVDVSEAQDAPAEAAQVADVITAGTERVKQCDDNHLDALFPNLEMIEDWVRAVRARIEARLFQGAVFLNVKLVQGKQGNRAWTDEIEAEKTLKSMRLKHDEMYAYKLISPTQAEKVLKESPKRWNKLQSLIGRSEGKPSVAPMSDKRPALVIAPPEDDFEAIEEGADLV